MICLFVLILAEQKPIKTNNISIQIFKRFHIYLEKTLINNFLANYKGVFSVLTAPIELELQKRPAAAVLWHWLEARCDVDTLPRLSTERRGKGRFTENVAMTEHAAPCYKQQKRIAF